MKVINGIATVAICTAITCWSVDFIKKSETGQELIKLGKRGAEKIKSIIKPESATAAE